MSREKYEKIYKELQKEGYSAEVDRTKLAYLLGAVDALRMFCGFDVPEAEYFHVRLGCRRGELIKCLRK